MPASFLVRSCVEVKERLPYSCDSTCEGAEILNKEAKNTAPKDQQAADDTDKDNDGFPDGSYDLLMIGDSVSLRAVDSFDGVFPHSHIDAEKGRQFDAGRATFEGYLQTEPCRQGRGLCTGHQWPGN